MNGYVGAKQHGALLGAATEKLRKNARIEHVRNDFVIFPHTNDAYLCRCALG